MAFDYQSWLKAAEGRLLQLRQQRANIDEEIAMLEAGLKGFAPLVETVSTWEGPDAGLTESIRQIFKENPKFWSPTEIRDELINRGVKLIQRNPMAAIHQILARLTDKEIRRVDVAGKAKYQTRLGESKSDTRPLITVTAKRKT